MTNRQKTAWFKRHSVGLRAIAFLVIGVLHEGKWIVPHIFPEPLYALLLIFSPITMGLAAWLLFPRPPSTVTEELAELNHRRPSD